VLWAVSSSGLLDSLSNKVTDVCVSNRHSSVGSVRCRDETTGQPGKIAAAIAPAVNIAKGQSGPGSLLDKSIDANAILNAQALAQREPILAPAVRARDLPLGVAAARFDIGTGEVTPLWTSFASI
jgi:hypothetical protein